MTSYGWQVIALVPLVLVALFIAAFHGDVTGVAAVVSVIVFSIILLFIAHRMEFPQSAAWGLVIAVAVHLAASVIMIGDTRLYEQMIISIAPTFYILRFDKIVHFTASAAIYYLLNALLVRAGTRYSPLYAGLATLGLGSLNEISEFGFGTIFIGNPERFGGLIDTETDMLFNLIGVLVMMGVMFLWTRAKHPTTNKTHTS